MSTPSDFALQAGSACVRCNATLKNNRIVNHTVYSWPIEDMSLRSTLALAGTKNYAMLGQSSPIRGTVGANVVKLYQDSNGTDEWQTTRGKAIPGVTFRGYRMYDGTTELEANNQARGWMELNNGTLGVAASVREFWQQCPKAMRISGNQLQVALLPGEFSEVFSLYDGSRKRHDVIYDFHAGALTDQQLSNDYLLAERQLHMRCEPSTYIASNAWDFGLGLAPSPGMSSYDRYATTGKYIGDKLGWEWFGGKYTAWGSGGLHDNQGSMFMRYVLWGDWRSFEQSEDRTLWTEDLVPGVVYDDVDWSSIEDTQYLYILRTDQYVTAKRYPGWTDYSFGGGFWGRPDKGHCGMLMNLEYWYLTGDRHAYEATQYYGQMARGFYVPQFEWNPPNPYSPYHGDPDDPSFMVSTRYWGWPTFVLVQAYEASGDASWLADAAIAVKGFRNAMRISPLKFTSEALHPLGDDSTNPGYARNFPIEQRNLGAGQAWGVFQIAITARAAAQYWLATGDMDAFDVMTACGEFLNESCAARDANGHVTLYPYSWGDYWGGDAYPATITPIVKSAVGMAALYCRRPQLQSDAQDVWANVKAEHYPQMGYLLQAVFNPSGDQTPPAAITTLAASQSGGGKVNLVWSVPGDDGGSGMAWRYQIKYSTAPIVEKVTGWPDWTPPALQTVQDWWDRSSALLATQRPFVSAINVLDLPSPSAPGTQQSKTVTGLTTGTTYYFAIKTLDLAGNLSDLSNVCEVTITDRPQLVGDVNKDGHVNVGDLQSLATAWGGQADPPSLNWNANADVDPDGHINVGDLQVLVSHWGESLN